MQRKLDLYRRYQNDYGVDFTDSEQDKIMTNYNETGVEVIVRKKISL
jgi:cytidylate kinase